MELVPIPEPPDFIENKWTMPNSSEHGHGEKRCTKVTVGKKTIIRIAPFIFKFCFRMKNL